MLLATACCLKISAKDVSTILPDRSLHILPAEIAKDNKAYVYSYNNEDRETNTDRFYVFDENFQVIKEFVTIPGTPNEYSYQIQERERIPISAAIYNEYQKSEALEINGISEGLSIETVINTLNESHYEDCNWEKVSLEDGNSVVANTSLYYNESYFGKKYPMYIYKQVNGLWYYFQVEYNTEYGPYGEWFEPNTYQSDGRYPSISYVNIIPLDGSDGEEFTLTRGIFSDDCCYVLPEYKKVEFNNEYTYENTDWVFRKEWGYKYEIRAFKVYDSSNKVVTSLDIPEGYRFSGEYVIDFLRLNDKRYIAIDISKPDDKGSSDSFTAIYCLDDGNNVNHIAIVPSTKVSPRTPRQGEIVSVTFDESTISFPKSINVVSTSGQNVYKTKVPAGQSSINIDTSRLNQGMYVVTVSAEGRNQEAAKIIVR